MGAKILGVLVFSLILALVLPTRSWAGYASIVVDAETGTVLHARNADTRNYPASLTKMMTLYLLFEAIDQGKFTMDSPLKVSANAAGQPPSKLGVKQGSTIKVEDAIKALVTKSANDVAVVVGEALGGTELKFATQMTKKARQLGMSRTTFRNASGLPNNGQMSTARDIAVLSMALMKHFPHHYHYFATESFRFGNRTVTTHNHVLKQYKGADGLKTGYIRASGFNVASSAVRDGHRIIGVVFGGRTARSRDAHMMKLLDEGFTKVAKLNPDVPVPDLKPGTAMASATNTDPLTDMGSADDAPLPPPPKPGNLVAQLSQQQASEQVAMMTPTTPSTPKAAAKVATAVPGKGTWGIQVGAYSQIDAARNAATRASGLLSPSYGKLHAEVLPHPASTGTLFRARILGMADEDEARGACALIQRSNRSCLVVMPTGSSMVFR
ncbi:MAG: D-alanyl-D-alanine carboxypeptidase [Rhodospirillum sp.]|nr:D-alanyl-D-alanine carboxypeptidase [Rhodospirillum sp.]MCF8491597.1 D-alanyl-D-alanine carboxypeptidase [Rhodospirillum sp.]MCF8499506.1 D-alanyl-D-alanine carboxypeptidase [Rhodospirillum sp.]